MLVLSRKAGQSLVIGGNIVVTILEADGDRIKIGVEAPRTISVLRGELHAEMAYENQLAGSVGSCVDQLLIPLLAKQQSSPAESSSPPPPLPQTP